MAVIHDWELLRVLLETARVGGFRRAQSKLGLTQPTIGKKIDRLEQIVGTKLVLRGKAGISLTSAGEDMVMIAEEMERLAERASLGPASFPVQQSGRLRLGVNDLFSGSCLPGQLDAFHREFPNITLDLQHIELGADFDLFNRETDVAVVYRDPTDSEVAVVGEAFIELAAFCAPGFAAVRGLPGGLDDMVNFPVVAQPFHYQKTGGMRAWAEMLEAHPMVAYRTGSSLVAARLVQLGAGIGLQPVGLPVADGDMVRLELGGYRCRLPCYLVCRRNLRDALPVRALLRHLQDALDRQSPGVETVREAGSLLSSCASDGDLSDHRVE